MTSDGNIVMKPGSKIYLAPGDRYAKLVENYDELTEEEKLKMDSEGFLYMNPFLCIINKSPLYTSYILDIFNVEKDLHFTYINQDSEYQYIASTVNWYRQYYTDRTKYKMDIQILQNIDNIESGILITESENYQKIIDAKLRVIAVFYDNKGIRPYRWLEADFKDYDPEGFILDYQFVFDTVDTDGKSDKYDESNRIKITNMKDVTPRKEIVQPAFVKEKVKCKILVFAEFPDGEYGRGSWDKWIPGLEGYTLTNEYDIADDLELFYNYTQIMSSDMKVTQYDPNTVKDESDLKNVVLGDTTWYTALRMPVIRDLYITTEKRMSSFIKDVERRRAYIEKCILELEDSFGVDLKFFNTYGPSTLFYLEDGSNINRTNLTLTFKMKPYTMSDVYIKDNIIVDIKEYLEDINNIQDFHAPNLTTYIETKYKDQLIYFEFVDFNGYGPGNQHIYMPESYHGDIVPEFLNININNDINSDIYDEPDIIINVIGT